MSATKGKKTSKSSSSISPPTKPTTTVSPKATQKPAAKTLFNYFTKLSKDKTENDLNESNRKRKLSAEINQQPPIKILKSSTDDVIVIDEILEPEITNPIDNDDDSLENVIPTPVEEKKALLIKFTPISKKKRELKNKNSKRKSKDAKSDNPPSTEMEVDEVLDEPALEIEENKDHVDQKSKLIVKAVNLDEHNEKEEEKVEPEVHTADIQKNVIIEEEKSKIADKNTRRKSTRIENSQEKIAEDIRNNAEAKMAKSETKPKKETKRKSTAHTETESSKIEKSDIKPLESNETVDKVETLDNSVKESKSEDLLIVSDNNSDGGLSDAISPPDNKNNLSQKLNSSSEKNLTPKQLKLQETRRKARVEKEKKIQEEREKRQKEKEEQRKKEREEKELKLKKEREEKEEQRKREKAEKDEQRAKEREEKERKRLEEIQHKNDEKRKRDEQKEEEKRKKEEERKKKEAEKEEEKREKEQERIKKEQEKLEEEQKKKREADNFKRFFRNSIDQTNPNNTSAAGGSISISSSQGNDTSDPAMEISSNFMPFCIKGNMKLAPCIRKTLTDDQKIELEKILKDEKLEKQASYLKQLKSPNYVIGKSEKTIPTYEEDEIMIIDDELATIGDEVVELKPRQQKYRAKFFLFNSNRRPPYYGTWRKKSTIVRPCKPFEMDTKYFNYEVDSDDEWEEDEPGESLKGSDDDYESNDDYEVDNEFFVPHGYLSDEENKAEMDGDGADIEENDNHPATQKAKLKILQQEFFAEHSKKTEKIKPKLIGCIWQNLNEDNDSDKYTAIIHKLLENHAMIIDGPIVLKPEIPPVEDNQTESATSMEFTNEEIQILIKLVHGNFNKRQFLVAEYFASRAEKLEPGKKQKLTKVKINNKIREIAEWKRCVTDNNIMNNRYCWIVKADYLVKFSLSDLDIFNTWKYTLKPLRTVPPAPTAKEDSIDGGTTPVTTATVAPTPVVNSITKYTTPISKLPQNTDISPKTSSSSSSTPRAATTKKSPTQTKPIVSTIASSNTIQPTKKRVNLLMSVPRGQVFPQHKKNTLISEYLNKGKLNNSSKNNVGKDDSVDKSKIMKNTSNPKAVESDETLSMDCDVIQLD